MFPTFPDNNGSSGFFSILKSFRFRILLAFTLLISITILLVGVVIFFGVPYSPYHSLYDYSIHQVSSHLGLVADLKKERLSLWLNERKADVTIIARAEYARISVNKLAQIAEAALAADKKPEEIKSALMNHESHRPLSEMLARRGQVYRGIGKLHITHTRTGLILVSTDNEEVGLSLISTTHYQKVASHGHRRGEFVDVVKDEKTGRWNLVLSQPVSGDSAVSGSESTSHHMLCLFADMDEFIKPLLYTGTGLGRTGEIVLVDQNRRILISPKYRLPDGTTAAIGECQVKGGPALLASQGQEGVATAEDYRGVPVLAAYRHIKVTPTEGWGLVVKQDQAEVFAPLWEQMIRICVLGILAVLGAVVAAILLSRLIVQPLQDLTKVAQALQAGNFSVRASAGGTSETATLSNAFNAMIERIQEWRHTLEREVRERTQRLAKAHDKLSGKMAALLESEEAIRASEAKYRSLVERAPVGIILIDVAGNIEEANANILEVLGSPSLEATKSINMMTFPLLVDAGISDSLRRCIDENSQQYFEGEYVSKWGKKSFLRILLAPMYEAGGALSGCQAIVEDITDRKSAERALQEERDKAQRYLDIAGVMLVALDQNGDVALVNRRACELLGLAEDQIVGKGWFRHFVPERFRDEVRKVFLQLMAGEMEPVEYFENPVLTSSGEERLIAWHNALITDKTGRNVGTLSSGDDITERRRAEEALEKGEKRLRSLIESSPVGIRIAKEGRHVFVNKSFVRMFGYDSPEEIMGKPVEDSYAPEEREKIRLRMRKVSGHTDVDSYFESAGLKRNGDRVDITIRSATVDYDGPAALEFIVDTSEEKSLRSQLLRAQKMESLGTLAGGIAHDFNNLLTVILGFSELLLMEKAPDNPDYEDLRKITHAARSGGELIQRILAFSRKAEIKPRPIDLNHEIRSAEKLLRRTIPKIIDIELILKDDLRTVNADPGHIEQVLLNMGVNSKDAMPGGGRFVIETENVTLDESYCKTHHGVEPGDYVLVSVADTGRGIEKEVLDHIFEPFFTTKKVGEGTGLGLAMVYGIVKQHKGHITCYSEVGKGTTFKIYLPVFEMPEYADDPHVIETVPGGNETILLVDDERDISELGEKILSKAGYAVLTASNGEEALELYRAKMKEISLVVLDLIMPVMEGRECLEELLKINPSVKVVIASGHSAGGPARKVVERGAKGFVKKPFDIRQLLTVVRGVLDSV